MQLCKLPPTPPVSREKWVKRYAWTPRWLSDGSLVWLEAYLQHMEYLHRGERADPCAGVTDTLRTGWVATPWRERWGPVE